MSTTTLPARGSTGTERYLPSGMVTTTSSPARAASSGVAAQAFSPSSFTSPASVSGPRELLSTTSCPVFTASRASWLPMCPAPMKPMVAMGDWYRANAEGATPRAT